MYPLRLQIIAVVLISEFAKVSTQNCTAFCNSQGGYINGTTCFWIDTSLYGSIGGWDNYLNLRCTGPASAANFTTYYGLAQITTAADWTFITTQFSATLSVAGKFSHSIS